MTSPPVLVVLRGNSGSGKTSVARELRRRHGRGCALLEQDYLRRHLLRERDLDGGLAPLLIAETARTALTHGYAAILEGILHTHRYREALLALASHGRTTFYYFDVPLEETIRRHETKPSPDFTESDLRTWFTPHDVLGTPDEHLIPPTMTFEETVRFVATTSGLPQTTTNEDHLPFA
ncbi:AAA family ATPase [Cryptosporangium phraense]|uniref:Kinase n=1 Tax=Cryptosporangium phraense TaxID=2593070 RepID=A0A545ALB8_9ACTN|nr:AAA family ATPase [Cryptosporangium phraense]TQS42081.1 kinase [Cryptosporangium phraense]